MIRLKPLVGCILLSSLFFVVTELSAQCQERAPQSNAPATPAANSQPDLTPPGYLPTDPLYNDGEVKLGRSAADAIAKEAKFSQDKALVARVQAIGAKIAAVADTTQVPAGFGNDRVMPYHYTYHVIDSDEINAFSLPGGFIYIYTGLIKLVSTDDELAGVLGHETAHAAHHHVSTLDHEANKMSNAMLLGVLASIIGHVDPGTLAGVYTAGSYGVQGYLNNVFSEHAEEDADHTGMIFMQKAGYNPVGMLAMLERLGQEEKKQPGTDLGFLQDHPLTPDRIAAARAELASLGVAIDSDAMRKADDALPVLVSAKTDPPGPSVTLYVSNSPVVVLAEADRKEAVDAGKVLDQLLDTLQLSEVRADGANLVARGHVLLTMTDADAKVQPTPMTPDDLAKDAKHKLQVILWSQVINGVGE